MRYLFYGSIILVFILLLAIIDQSFYWLCRIFVHKHLANILRLIYDISLILIIGGASIWGHYVTRFKLNVTHIDVVSQRWPASFDGYRIAHISDMHLDCFNTDKGVTFLNGLIDEIGQQQPDIIVFTGDLVTTQSAEAEPFKEQLHRLAHIPSTKVQDSVQRFIPVYSVLGNHDYADYTSKSPKERLVDVKHLCELMTDAGWTILNNECIELHPENPTIEDSAAVETICLIGVENIGEPPFSTYGDLTKAMKQAQGTAQILLSHNPTHWRSEVLPNTDIDLTLSGHTHAVQIQVGSWSPAKWKYAEWGGLYEASQVIGQDNTPLKATTQDHPQYLYVNTGIGGVGPRVRIGVRPELTILTLKNQ